MGYITIASGTVRTKVANVGVAFPEASATTAVGVVRTPRMTVTNPGGQTGATIYIAFNATAPGRNVLRREREMIKLDAGQSFEFPGQERGGGAVRDMSFGTGISYIMASATSVRAVLTWYKWS